MAICSHLAPNGEKSLLYDQLSQKYGDDKAHDIWTAIRTQQFLNEHGDWSKNKELKEIPELKKSSKKESVLLKLNGEDETVEAYAVTIPGQTAFKAYVHKAPWNDKVWVLTESGTHKAIVSEAKTIKEALIIGKDNLTKGIEGNKKLLTDIGINLNTTQTPLDVNGEPTIDWVKEKLALPDAQTVTEKETESRSFEPTDAKATLRSVQTRDTEADMLKKISDTYAEARANPNKVYRMEYNFTNPRKRFKSGYSAIELANLFDRGEIPANVQFSDEMYKLIQNSSRRIVQQLGPDTPTELINRNEQVVQENAAMLLVPKVNAAGQTIGFFDSAEHQQVVDSLKSATQSLLTTDPNLKANALLRAFYIFDQKRQQMDAEGTSDSTLRDNLFFINQQRVRFADSVLRAMKEEWGLVVDDQSRSRILQAVELLRPLDEQFKSELREQGIAINDKVLSPDTGEFIEATGRGLRDWSEISFELDPRDTASSRIKRFIGTVPEMDRGSYLPNEAGGIKLDPADIRVEDRKLIDILAHAGSERGFELWKQEDPAGLQSVVRRINRRGFWMINEKTSEALQSFLNRNYPMVAKENFIGRNTLADFNATFQSLMEMFADVPAGKLTHDYITETLNSSTQPTLQYLSRMLKGQDEQLKNEFAKVVSKQYQPFMMILFNTVRNPDGSESYSLNPINANRYNQKNTLIKNWQEQQKLSDLMIVNQMNQRVLDIDRIKSRWLPMLEHGQKVKEWDDAAMNWAKQAMGNILRTAGVGITDEMMDYFIKNMEKITKGTKFEGGVARQFRVTETGGEPDGLFSSFIMRASGLDRKAAEDEQEQISEEQENARAAVRNPLYYNPVMQVVASVVARFTPVLHSQMHKSSEGKNIWDYGMNSKLSHMVQDMMDDFDTFAKTYDNVDIARDNWLLTYLKNNPAVRKNIQLSYLDGIKPTWGNRGTIRPKMSDREQMLTAVALFQNQGNGLFNKTPRVHYMSLTHADKSTTPVFANMPRLSMGNSETMPRKIVGDIGSAFYNVFKAEHSRIVNQTTVDFNNAQYNKGKSLFYLLPEFNYDSMERMVRTGTLSKKEFNLIWVNGQRNLTKVIREDKELPVINKILTGVMDDMVRDTKDRWKKMGIVKEDFTMFDQKYTKKVLSMEGIKSSKDSTGLVLYRDREGKDIDKQEVTRRVTETAAKDFALNYFLFNSSLSQLFYGDPAMVYKASKKTDATDMDHVSSTLIEYGKRLAKDTAPGQDPYWKPEDRSFNTITLKDVKPAEKYLSQFDSLRKPYSEVEGTDAQELTTVEEHLKVSYAMGLVPTKVYREMLKIVSDAGKGGYYEFTSPEHLAIVLQPMKPVYAGRRTAQNGALLEDYVKSSSYPLYPPMLSGDMEMNQLRVLMETKGIDRAAFASARKIGAPSVPFEAFDREGNFNYRYDPKQFDAATQVLDRSGFRIQQEVPYDESKEHILTVSQMNKLITEGIEDIKRFDIGGKEMDGKQVRTYKEHLRTQLIAQNLRNLLDKLTVRKGDSSMTITSKSFVYDMLTEEARKKGYTLNELQGLLARDDKGDLQLPLMFNSAADRLESLLMSLVNKVPDVHMPGKSFIQASSVGYTFKKESGIDQSKVVWVPGYDGSPLKTMRRGADGKTLPAQVIMPFNFFDHDGTKRKVEEFMTTDANGRRTLNLEKIPKELLQMIGARIPNQGHSSMIAIEVVGFTPDSMGDIIIVPAAITRQMGADFDVDKLFTYKRNYASSDTGFKVVDNKKERLGADEDEWTDLKERTHKKLDTAGIKPDVNGQYLHRDFNQHLAQAVQEKYPDGNVPKHEIEGPADAEHLQNEYFNVHWGTLMHPDMLEKVLQPLDKEDLKDENKLLAPKVQPSTGYFHIGNQMDEFQSGRDSSVLRALASLSMTFNSVIQDKNLHMSKLEAEMGEDGKVRLSTVPDHIQLRDERSGGLGDYGRLSGNGHSNFTTADRGEPTDTSRRSKHDNHAMVLSAAVDNAKYRSLDNLNITVNTYRALAGLSQLEDEGGQAVSIKYGTRLLTQPIIRDFEQLMRQGNDSLSTEYTRDLKQTVFAQLREKYLDMTENKEAVEEKAKEVVFDPQTLLKAQTMSKDDEFVIHQLAALDLFRKLDAVGTRLSELQNLFNQDVSGAGANILTALDKATKMGNINQTPVSGADAIYGFAPGTALAVPQTEAGITFVATIDTTNKVLTQLLPYDKLTTVIHTIRDITGRDNLTIDQQRKIVRSVRSYTFAAGSHWWKEAQSERVRLLYDTAQGKSLGKRIADAKLGWGKDSHLLMRIDPKIGDLKDAPDYLEYQASTSGRTDEEQNTRSWLEMLMSPDEEKRRLGEDLLRYAYLTGGVQDANSFVRYAPVSYILGTEFGTMLRNKEGLLQTKGNQFEMTDPGFVHQYFQHNPDMAVQVDRKLFKDYVKDGQDYPESFRVDIKDKDLPASLLTGDMEVTPYVGYRSKAEGKWILYTRQYIGDNVYYTRIDTLGNQYTDEWDGNRDTAIRSIFTENRALADMVPAADAEQIEQNYKRTVAGNIYSTGSGYDRIGLKEGAGKEIDDSIQNIIGNEAVPQHLRSTAEIFAATQSKTKEAAKTLGAVYVPTVDFKIEEEDRKNKVRGITRPTGKISLNTELADTTERAAETFLHEVAHLRMQTMIMAAGFDPRIYSQDTPKANEELRQRVEQFRKDNPLIVGHIEELERIRYEALNHYRFEIGTSRFNQLVRDLQGTDKTRVNSPEHLMVYALSSVHELTAHVMTDSKVAQYLNRIDSSKGNSIVSRFISTITDLFTKLAEAFGFKVNEKGLFKEALHHTIALTASDIAEYRNINDGLVPPPDLPSNDQLQVKTEAEARELKKLYEQSYGREVTITNNIVNHAIGIGKKKHNVPGQAGRVLDKLQRQLEDAGYNANMGTREQRTESRARYRELKEDIDRLQRERDLDMIADIGKKQLQWVDKVLRTDHPTTQDLQAAIGTANIWSDLINIVYGNQTEIADINRKFADLQAEAQKRRILLDGRSLDVASDFISSKGIRLTKADIREELQDINLAESNFLALTRVKPLLVQGIASVATQKANNIDELIKRSDRKLDSIEKRMKAAGLADDHFIQDDTWSLVQRLSGKWHAHVNKLAARRDGIIENIGRAPSNATSDKARREEEENRSKAKGEAWQNYWKEIKKVAVFADVRKLFNMDTGEKLNTHDKVVEDLAKELGSEDYAKELAEEAHRKFKDYLEEREIYKQLTETYDLSSEEKEGKSTIEQEKLLKQKKEDAYSRWLRYNSPIEFMRSMNSDKGHLNAGDRWLSMAPRADKPEFYDDRYRKIQENDKVRGIYEDYKVLLEELWQALPEKEREKVPVGALPIVSPETVNNLSTMIGKVRNWDTTILNALTATDAEEAARLRPDRIPIMYTRGVGRTADAANRSRDIIRITRVFARMALHYKHMQPVLAAVEIAQSMLQEVNRQRLADPSQGKQLKNVTAALEYFKDAIIFKKPQQLQGRVEHPIYSIKPAVQLKMEAEMKQMLQQRDELSQQIMDEHLEGNWDVTDLDEKRDALNEKIDLLNEQARNIYGSKIINSLVTLNQLKALTLNPFSAVTNFTFAAISIHIYAKGKGDFTTKDAQWGWGKMMRSFQKYMSFGFSDNPDAQKIAALVDRTGVMTELGLSGAEVSKTARQGINHGALHPYNWQISGDYFNKGMLMLSMLHKQQVEVTSKATGEKSTVSLWDALDQEGNWNTKKYEENEDWYSDDIDRQQLWNNYRDRIRKVSMLVFGNQDKNAPLMAKKQWLMRLAGQFRMSWFPEGIATRFQKEHYDIDLGRDVKGRWRSYSDLGIAGSVGILCKQLLNSLPGVNIDPFSGKTDRKGNPISDLDVENMRKNFTGLAYAVGFTASVLLLRALVLSDEKGKKKTSADMGWQLLVNTLIRNQQDLMLYSSPSVINQISGNLLPATGVITDSYKAVVASGKYMLADDNDKQAFDKWLTATTRAFPVLDLYPKTKYMMTRDLDKISNR